MVDQRPNMVFYITTLVKVRLAPNGCLILWKIMINNRNMRRLFLSVIRNNCNSWKLNNSCRILCT